MKTGRVLLMLSILIIGVIIYINKCNPEKNDGAASSAKKNPSALAVNGVVVFPQSLEFPVLTSGTLLANEEVELRNEVPGKIIKINFTEGSRVHKGELLIKLYDDDLKAQLKKLLLQKELAEKNENRQKDLLGVNGISQQDYESAANALNTINADIELIRTSISKTEIVAPFDGVIGLKSVSVGAFLTTNTVIASIQDIDPLKIDFSIPERYRDRISTQTQIQFTTETAKGIFKGRIYAIEPKVDLSTRSFMVRAIYPNSGGKIYPGGFANVTIPLATITDAILIPTQSLIPELKGQSVYISENGMAKKVSVSTGLRNDSTVQITEGITAGDTVLTTGIMQVRPKMPLKIQINN
jgi:membrane fusion protein (multidrug efflux system)